MIIFVFEFSLLNLKFAEIDHPFHRFDLLTWKILELNLIIRDSSSRSNTDITKYVGNVGVRYVRKSHPTRWRIRVWDRDSIFSTRGETGGGFLYAAAFSSCSSRRSEVESREPPCGPRIKVADVRECACYRKCAHIRLPNWSNELLFFFLLPLEWLSLFF